MASKHTQIVIIALIYLCRLLTYWFSDLNSFNGSLTWNNRLRKFILYALFIAKTSNETIFLIENRYIIIAFNLSNGITNYVHLRIVYNIFYNKFEKFVSNIGESIMKHIRYGFHACFSRLEMLNVNKLIP